MRLIHVGVAALNQTPLAWRENRDNALAAIAASRAAGVSVLCLPELCLTGYGCEDMFGSLDVAERAARGLFEHIAPATAGMVVSVGIPVHHLGAVYDAAALCVDGEVVGLVAKQNLAGDGIHYEPRWFKPWPVGERSEVEIAGRRLPIGDLVFDVGGVRIGFEICEDAWVADRPGGRLAHRGVDIVLNPSASHFAFQKQIVRRRFVLEGSRAFGVAYLYANLLGNEAGRAIYDGGTMIASEGKIVVEGPRFSFEPCSTTHTVVDVDAMRMQRARLASFVPGVSVDGAVEVPFAFPDLAATAADDAARPLDGVPAWDGGPTNDEEEFSRAMALGLFDYARKAGSRGFVVSLSGGADSTACAALVALMVRLATEELGLSGFAERFAHVPGLETAASAEELVARLLTTAYQSTKNSGEVTRNAAEVVAEALGATHHEIDVDSLVDQYVSLVEGALGRPLTWESDDIALQNIQARVRSPSIWLIANVESKILLATSNRSEAAVGYATMDGDTSGGLSPIAGIDKAFLGRWLRFMELHGPVGAEPLPVLSVVNAQQPTAELRPPAAGQTDEGDLMPYPLLDAIEHEAIGGKKPPTEVYLSVAERFPTADPEQLRIWVRRFFSLFCRNQWKRERYAPSFHVDDKNLDPRTWCRFPILSGGFLEELEELDALVAGERLMAHSYEYPRAALTVDCVVFGLDDAGLHVLLVERGAPPFEGGWALPGGFVHVDETIEDAARRELAEETGLTDVFLEQLYTFGALDRDPRERVVSVAYYALTNIRDHRVRAATDARDAAWFEMQNPPKLAFDHADILDTAMERLRGKVAYRPIGFELLPKKFTLSQLQHLYETILERELDKRNFRKKVLSLDLLVPTGELERDVPHRRAALYRFDRKKYRQLEREGFELQIA